jgi:hypothetical protein
MKYNSPPGMWALGIESGDPFSETAWTECKKMLNTEDMGITSLVNILGGSTCDTLSFFQHPC